MRRQSRIRCEIKPKWRYLSLYRILEHGYLSEVFHTLMTEFFSTPKDSLKKASDAVGSEFTQFMALAETGSLETDFQVLLDEFEKAKALPNQFAIKVDRSIQQGRELAGFTSPANWRRGVLVCYKIRNAIVHAGLPSPIFEAFPDGSECLEALLPTLELLTLKFLGITIA